MWIYEVENELTYRKWASQATRGEKKSRITCREGHVMQLIWLVDRLDLSLN